MSNRKARERTVSSPYHFDQLLARRRAGAAGVGTVVFAYLVAHFGTMGAYVSACLANVAVEGRVADHEMRSRRTQFGAIQHGTHSISKFFAFLKYTHRHIQADGMSI